MQLRFMDIDRRAARYRLYRSSAPSAWQRFLAKVELSWLYHDYAMDGLSLSQEDIARALSQDTPRHHCDAQFLSTIRQVVGGIRFTIENAARGADLSLEDVKKFHAVLVEPGASCGGRYRKSEGPMVPYLHTITRTPSISYRLRKLVEAMDGEYREMPPVKAAALIHYDFMSIWPFDMRSSTAGRLLMNHWLMSHGYPPAIIHAKDRQAYFHALDGRPEELIQLVSDSVSATLECADAFFGAHSTAHRVA